MGVGAGFGGQFMYKTETTVGTGVTVDTGVPFVSESVKQSIDRLPTKGIRAGRRMQTTWRPGKKTIAGSVKLELPNLGCAALFKHLFGAVVTTGSGPYVHTFTPGTLLAKAMTMQFGRPDQTGTVQPFTYAGTKIKSAEISAKAGEIAELTLDVTAWTETTGTALATYSEPSGWAPFTFVDGSLTIAAGAVTVEEVNLKFDNGLKDDRFRLGAATIIEQLESAVRSVTGTMTADFVSLTAYNRFVNGTEAALVLTFSNGTESLVITMNVEFDGETPNVDGPDVLMVNLPFTCTSGTSDAAAITAVLTNGQSSAA